MIDNSKYILFTLLAYKLILILIGLWSRKKNNSVSDYFIASRKLGPWIAALSAWMQRHIHPKNSSMSL